MSITDIHGELISSLESALDVGKIFSVFNKLITIIKDQQEAINQTESKVADLYDKLSRANARAEAREKEFVKLAQSRGQPQSDLTKKNSTVSISSTSMDPDFIERINGLETKLNELLINMQGDGGEAVLSLVEDISPYEAFEQASALMSKSISPVPPSDPPSRTATPPNPVVEVKETIPDQDVENSGVHTVLVDEMVVEMCQDVSQLAYDLEQDELADRVLSNARTPTPPSQEQEQEEEVEVVVEAEVTPVPDQIIIVDEEEKVNQDQQSEGIVEEQHVSRVVTPAPIPPPASTPLIASPAPYQPPSHNASARQTPKAPCERVSPVADITIEEQSVPVIDEHLFKPVTPEVIPVVTTQPQLMKKKVRLVNKSTSPEAVSKMNSGTSPVFRDGSPTLFAPAAVEREPSPLPELPPVVIPKANIARRRMSLSNLTLLTPKKRAKILKALKRKGMFIHIARHLQEDALKKYANQSLKQRVDCLDAEIRRVYSRIEHLKNAVKKDHIALRELLPLGFHDNYCNLVELLSVVNTSGNEKGLLTFDNIMKNAMCYDPRTGEPPTRLLEIIMDKMRSTVLQQFEMRNASEMTKFKARLVELSAMVVTKDDIKNMLLTTSPNVDQSAGTDKANVSVGDTNTDPTHAKLLNLINRSIERYHQGVEMANANKKYATLDLSGGGASEAQLEEIRQSNQKYTDERIAVMKNAIKQLAYQSDSRINQYDVDISQMQEKIMSMQSLHQNNMISQAENIEMFKRESESLKVLQRKVGNMGIDRLMEDLKGVHVELLQRPSAGQVSEMMDLVEHTIKSHLGENIVGLKGLVEQVYKHIQHKVDRDDIKNLISVKLAQMEADLLRREEEVYTMTSTTRCLSCGQRPQDPNQRHAQSLHAMHSGNTSTNHSQQQPHAHASTHHAGMDDDISASSGLKSIMSQSTPMFPHATGEQIHSAVTGGGGLKPLLPQHSPLKPTKDPYNNVPARRRGTADKIPEPMFRKAKMASQIKEMVKIAAPTTAMYGYGPTNPLYVMDGMVDNADANNDIDNASVQSELSTITPYKGSGGTSGRNKNGIHINNMSTNANAISNVAVHNHNSQNGSRRTSTTSSATAATEYVVLPSIVRTVPLPPSLDGSKPNSPIGDKKLNSFY